MEERLREVLSCISRLTQVFSDASSVALASANCVRKIPCVPDTILAATPRAMYPPTPDTAFCALPAPSLTTTLSLYSVLLDVFARADVDWEIVAELDEALRKVNAC